MSPLHVGLCGPVAGQDIAALMGMEPQALPRGYEGAPLLVTLIEGLLARGHRVSVFTLSNDLSFAAGAVKVASRLHPGLELHFCPLRRHAWRPCEGRPGRILDLYRHERRALVEAMRQAAPAVIHAHWAYEFAWAALDTGIPTVVTCHDSPLLVARMNALAKPTISLYRGLRVLMAWQVLRRARWVTAVSPYLAAALEGMSPRPLQVIPNPVDGRSLVLGRDRRLGQALRIAMVSNGFDQLKNPKKALLAFAKLRASRPQARLHLFGRGFERDGEAVAWCRSRPDLADCLPAMSFHGPLGHAELLERLAACDLLIHPALEEAFGMALAEAMALGLPVVAGRHSGAVPWVVQDARCLCEVKDPEAIAEAADALLQGEVYAQLSRELRAMVARRFALEAVLQRYEAVYREALEGASSARESA